MSNPFMQNTKIDVIILSKNRSIMTIDQLLNNHDKIIENPELGTIKVNYLVEKAKHINLYQSVELRKVLLNLSLPAHTMLRYIECNLRYNEDTVYLNQNKIIQESNIKSKTTINKGIQELIQNNFISLQNKNTYWINPNILFYGDKTKVFSSKLNHYND